MTRPAVVGAAAQVFRLSVDLCPGGAGDGDKAAPEPVSPVPVNTISLTRGNYFDTRMAAAPVELLTGELDGGTGVEPVAAAAAHLYQGGRAGLGGVSCGHLLPQPALL